MVERHRCGLPQAVEPDRRADRRQSPRRRRVARQPVVAAAADRRRPRRAGVGGLEDEAGVIVEIAHEGGGIDEVVDRQPARGEEADALVERVERLVEVEAGVGGERAQRARRRVGMAGNGEEASQRLALFGADARRRAAVAACSRKRSAISPERAAADRRRCRRSRAGPRPAPWRPSWSARSSAASTPALRDRRQAVARRSACVEAVAAGEAAPHAPAPMFRQAERADARRRTPGRRRSAP